MTKMTVLYAVFVALLFLVARTPAHPHRGGVRTGRAARRHRHRARRATARRGVGRACSSRSCVGAAGRARRHRRRPAGRRLARLRRLVGRHRAGRDRPDRGGVPALRQLAHLRRDRWRRPRRAVPGAGGGGHVGPVAQLALPVRLGDAAARLVGPALVGAAALRRSRPPALVGLAQVLRGRRDLGSGMLAARPGPATGSPRLADAVALSIRLHGPMLLGWTVALAVLGLVLGSIAPNIGSMLDSPAARDMMARLGGQGALEDTLDRGRAVDDRRGGHLLRRSPSSATAAADEHDGRTEQVLATATSRSHDVRGHPGRGAGRSDLAAARVGCGGGPRRRYGVRRSRRHVRRHRPGRSRPGSRRLAGHGDRRGGVLLEEPVGGARLGLPGALPDPRPARRAAPAATDGDRPVAVRARAEDAGRVLRGRPLCPADRVWQRRCSRWPGCASGRAT